MKQVLNILIFIIITQSLYSQEKYVPTTENLEARQWFKEARFGLFIHWGVYSTLGDGEWAMNKQEIAIDDYGLLPTFFNPTQFNADEWVRMAKDAGMKYITITTRHHDGFSMFDSKISDYNIVEKTPYKKDVMKLMAEACRKEGIKLFFYYSLLDWHNDDYFPRGKTGREIKGRGEGNWNNYINFMKGQLTELLTNYGEITGIWFDGHWDQMLGEKGSKVLQVDWHYDEIYKVIHDLQPQCLIGNNHHMADIQGEDFQMFERDLPGQNHTGFGTDASDLGELPYETCKTINGSWGFKLQDNKHKSGNELIQTLVKTASHNSNLLLNVGPMPNGKIQEEHIASLTKVGEWLRSNGVSIYSTSSGPIQLGDSIVSTRKDKTIYLHFLKEQVGKINIPHFKEKIKKVTFFNTNESINYQLKKENLSFEIPESKKNSIDTIIILTLK